MNTHRPLVWITLSFCLGILMEFFWQWPSGAFVSLGSLLIVLGVLSLKRRFFAVWIVAAFVVLGVLGVRSARLLPDDHIQHVAKYYRKKNVEIEGIVVTDVQRRAFFKGKKTLFTLEVTRCKAPWGWRRQSGKVLVNVFRDEEVAYGDYVRLEGKIHRPFEFSEKGHLSYTGYLKRKGILRVVSVGKQGRVEVLDKHRGNQWQDVALQVRQRLKAVLVQYLPVREAGLINALILGERYDIPSSIKDVFVKTGTAHILAISGFNVGIVAALVLLCLKVVRVPRRGQYLLTIFILMFYALLTGAQSPVVRATITAAIFLGSFILEREIDPLNSLSLAALVILIVQPLDLFDVGFQLSFVSVLFIVQLCPGMFKTISEKIPAKPLAAFVQWMMISVVAWVGVAGLIAYYFQIITPVTVIANLVIIPLTSLNTVLGVGLIAAGMVCPVLAPFFAACIHGSLNAMVMFVYALSQIPGAYVKLPLLPWLYVITYYLVVAAVIYGKTAVGALGHMGKGFRFLRRERE